MVKYCQECGAELEDDAKFCDGCGNKVDDDLETLASEDKIINKPSDGSILSKIENLLFLKDGNGVKKLNIKLVGIVAIILIILLAIVFGGALTPKTTYEFDGYNLTIPSDYQASYGKTFSGDVSSRVEVFNGDGLTIGFIDPLGVDNNNFFDENYVLNDLTSGGNVEEATIGGHSGYLVEKNANDAYDAYFYFKEDDASVWKIGTTDNYPYNHYSEGSYDNLKLIVEGFQLT